MARSKLDPGLKYVHACRDKERPDSQFTCVADPAVPTRQRVNVLLEIEQDSQPEAALAELAQAEFREHTHASTIISGDVPVANVDKLAKLTHLKRVEASRLLHRELDEALPESKVPVPRVPGPGEPRPAMAQRGHGVIIGLIDFGIDFRHPSFQNEDGSSRILALWDQGLKPISGEKSPIPYGYGVLYSQEEISDTVRSKQPKVPVRHREQGPIHGTHVAGIAAGNGRPAAESDGVVKYVGMAPNADLVVVANTRPEARNPGTLGDSADAFDAIKFILDFAAGLGKPVVINHSHGDNIGPHDGSSLLEVGIDQLITGPGRVMVKSAGNEADAAHHAQGDFTDQQSPHRVKVQVSPGCKELILDFWYPGEQHLDLRIVAPDGDDHRFPPTVDKQFTFSNGNIAHVFTDENDAGNHDNRIFVVLQDGSGSEVVAGRPWVFELSGNGSWHGWMQRDSLATFDEKFASPLSTISIPGTAKSVISVGAYVNHSVYTRDRAGEMSEFSSCGPTRDKRPAPTLAAPGEEVTSTLPDPAFFGPMSGTSMSAPLVTGAAALLFQINRHLTAADIRDILVRAARRDGHTGTVPNNQWGAGKLDVEAACAMASERLQSAHSPA
jgi:subtilisin family serine protease